MSRNFAFLRPLLAFLLIAGTMAAAAGEEPLSDVPLVALDTVINAPAVAALGDQMLVVWNDRRNENAVYAARFKRDGRRLPEAPIRIIPPEPDVFYREPSVASDGTSFVVAMRRGGYEDYQHSSIALVRITKDGVEKPRIVAAGFSPRLYSNGETFLLVSFVWRSNGGRLQLTVLSRDFKPLATLELEQFMFAAAPIKGGYMVVLSTNDSGTSAIRVADDGSAHAPIPIGKAGSAAVASAGARVVILSAFQSTVRTTVIDGENVIGPTKVASCQGEAVVRSMVTIGDGYLATARCESAFQKVMMPPPLPRHMLHTFRFDRSGTLTDIEPAPADLTTETGEIVNVAGELLVPTTNPVRIARLTDGELALRDPIAVGAPDVREMSLVRDGDSDIVRWLEFGEYGDLRAVETRITRHGVDPQLRGVKIGIFDSIEPPPTPGETIFKLYHLITPFLQGEQLSTSHMVIGNGEDGFMVVVNHAQGQVTAFHVDPAFTRVDPLGALGDGTAALATRRDGYGIVIFSRKQNEAPFFGASRYFAIVTN